MTDFSYAENVKNTVIAEFHTSIPIVTDAFKTFIKTFDCKHDLTLSDIRDHRVNEKAFATYAGDIIFMSQKKIENDALKCVRGITALSDAVYGFKLFLPEGVPIDVKLLEELCFYVLPADKTYPFDGLINVGIVTSEKRFVITAYDGHVVELLYERTPNRAIIDITSPEWFTRGFYDATISAFDRLSGQYARLHSSLPQIPNDCVAYRLGIFYASKCMIVPKKRKKPFLASNARVYLFAPLPFADGTPDINTMQLISSLLANKHINVIVSEFNENIAYSVQSILPEHAFVLLATPNDQIENARLIITDCDLPLPILGVVSK